MSHINSITCEESWSNRTGQLQRNLIQITQEVLPPCSCSLTGSLQRVVPTNDPQEAVTRVQLTPRLHTGPAWLLQAAAQTQLKKTRKKIAFIQKSYGNNYFSNHSQQPDSRENVRAKKRHRGEPSLALQLARWGQMFNSRISDEFPSTDHTHIHIISVCGNLKMMDFYGQ